MDGRRENDYGLNTDDGGSMKKLDELLIDAKDFAYWSGIFGMAGAASLAVAFIDFSVTALVFGIASCIIGRQLNRKG